MQKFRYRGDNSKLITLMGAEGEIKHDDYILGQEIHAITKIDGTPLILMMDWEEIPESSEESSMKQRCIIPVTGFWEKNKKEEGTSMYFEPEKESDMFFIGGIWRKTDKSLKVSMITSEPMAAVRANHEKIPFMVKQEDLDLWLDNSAEIKGLKKLETAE